MAPRSRALLGAGETAVAQPLANLVDDPLLRAQLSVQAERDHHVGAGPLKEQRLDLVLGGSDDLHAVLQLDVELLPLSLKVVLDFKVLLLRTFP